ncbi:MAG TPA: phosphoserine phosphatase SerB [Prosthecobacter sp.]
MFVATVVAHSQKRNLTEEVLEEIAAKVPGANQVKVLEEGVAADIYFDAEMAELPALPAEFDWIVQKAGQRTKKLLVCDMESTIVANEFLDEIADLGGFKEKVADITERAMNGQLDFKEATNARIQMICGMQESAIRELLQTKLLYNPGARELLAACKKAGIYTMLVSGGFSIFAEHVAQELGFDEVHASRLIFDQGVLAGIEHPMIGKEAKLEIMTAQAGKMGISLGECAAAGDGANDLPMLHAAGLGIAYRAKPNVRAEIRSQINASDLMAIAYAIGAN